MDTIETLNGRIEVNQAKLTLLIGKDGLEPEIDRLRTAIQKVLYLSDL